MQECKELQEKIAAQTFNRDDVIRMNDERCVFLSPDEFKAAIHIASMACSKIQTGAWAGPNAGDWLFVG